ncbi:MAG: hypothetical protein AAB613_01535 [Patescibacteria group bacterium]
MKTGMFFGILFWLGAVMLLATAGLQLSSAVWHETRIQSLSLDERLMARLEADETQVETIASTNANLGWPGIISVTVGALGWFFRPLPRRNKKVEDFPGRADPEFFDRLWGETSSDIGGYKISRQ